MQRVMCAGRIITKPNKDKASCKQPSEPTESTDLVVLVNECEGVGNVMVAHMDHRRAHPRPNLRLEVLQELLHRAVPWGIMVVVVVVVVVLGIRVL